MSNIDKWLIDIGLAHLAQTFARAEIDFEGLKLVTDQDLREMQIPVGPRRKLIAALTAMSHPPAAALEDGQRERRQLTILFCDMVDSTRYAAQLDPEDFSELTQNYLARCGTIARSHGGFVANYVGDALQVLFGYPLAEEDDAERALALALELVEAVPRIETPDGVRPEVRIGIASGLVVVGDVRGAPKGVSTVAFGPRLCENTSATHGILSSSLVWRKLAGFCAYRMLEGVGDGRDGLVWRLSGPKWRFSCRLKRPWL
jgi:class 3 adenylate cyclase